jgi:hypothetical protein
LTGDEDERRTTVNLAATIVLLLVAIAMIWVFRRLDERSKLEVCLEAGRRDCASVIRAGPE